MSANDTPVSALERLGQSAQDALTDEMVARLAEAASGGLTLLDQLNRSGVGKALPVLAKMAENGDLERVAQLARLVGSAQDALTDEMVARLAELVSKTLTLLDRVAAQTETFERALRGVQAAASEAPTLPPARGGIGGLLALARDRDTQEALRFLALVTKHIAQSKPSTK